MEITSLTEHAPGDVHRYQWWKKQKSSWKRKFTTVKNVLFTVQWPSVLLWDSISEIDKSSNRGSCSSKPGEYAKAAHRSQRQLKTQK